MSSPGKRFTDHSSRWQREQLKSGVDPRRWDAWQNLAPSTRKGADRNDYARGIPAPKLVKEKRINDLAKLWEKKLKAAGAVKVRPGKLYRNVKNMSNKMRKHITDDTPEQLRFRPNRPQSGDTPRRYDY